MKASRFALAVCFSFCVLHFAFVADTRAATASEAALDAIVPERHWQGIPGLERTAGGRLFVTFSAGTAREAAMQYMILICHSDDDGKTHSPPKIISYPNPADGSRCFDAVPWIDPKGRLWCIYNRASKKTGQYGVYARICDTPDAPEPVFGPEFRIGFGVPCSFRLNKPIVLSTGEWIMPVTFSNEAVHAWNASKAPQLQGVGISRDEGAKWTLHGAVDAPAWALEGMVTEMKDDRLWMLIRSGAGRLYESFSTDKGVTWSKGARTKITNPPSRFFIRRLSSGNLLLVNHYNFDENGKNNDRKRSHLTAQLSTDEGKTWSDGLLLDARQSVSYPDGVQDKDGLIRIIYDRDRRGAGAILMAKFREEDAAKGANVSGAVVLRQTISSLAPKTNQ